ncbi:MAG TPA: hypothetical protein VK083_17365 [Nocardia sp.]|uniref:hypothetical protein n=1 Tax=Nocardia TaxID=1817 RepID=UPI00245500D5|nr:MULTISPECIES: hypothetical protein [Nocardia]HLS78552.1 hypothetical protein [Nocardia sp.]
MTSRPSFLSANSRNRLIAAALLGAAGGAAWIVRSKRPLPPEPAPEPPRIGHTREVTADAAPTPAVASSNGATAAASTSGQDSAETQHPPTPRDGAEGANGAEAN